MSLPTTAPAANAARATAARQVSTARGTSRRARRASTVSHTEVGLLPGRHVPRADPAGARAHVEDVGAVADERLRAPQQRVEAEEGALVVERVRRAVEDAHDHGPGRGVEAVRTETQVRPWRGRLRSGGHQTTPAARVGT